MTAREPGGDLRPLRVGDVLLDPDGGGYFRGELGHLVYAAELRVEALGADWMIVRDVLRGTPYAVIGNPETWAEPFVRGMP